MDKLTVKSRIQNIPNMWEGARTLAQKGVWYRKVDLRAAYWKIPVTEEARRALCFEGPNGEVYTWNGMPFGPAEAPTVFNSAIGDWLETIELPQVVQYFDDFVCFGDTPEECNANTDKLIAELDKWGFIVNEEKSTWDPSHEIIFCGYRIKKGYIGIPKKVLEEWSRKKDSDDIRKVRGALSRWSWFINDKNLFRSPDLQFRDLPKVVRKWLAVQSTLSDLELWTDASSLKDGSCGLTVTEGGEKSPIMEKSWLLAKNIRSKAIPIWEKELRALKEGLEWLPTEIRNNLRVVHIDNYVAERKIKNWDSKRKPLTPQEHLVATVKKTLRNIKLNLVKSADNLADIPSRAPKAEVKISRKVRRKLGLTKNGNFKEIT